MTLTEKFQNTVKSKNRNSFIVKNGGVFLWRWGAMNPRPYTHVLSTSTDIENFWLFFERKCLQTDSQKTCIFLSKNTMQRYFLAH